MELAQRIKNARLEAGLSQRQLCGEVITRNMLSLIESGRARPSMDTLQHFSRVLGKPMSYFLEEDAVLSPKQAAMGQAEAAFGAGDYAGALTALEAYRAPDGLFDQTRYLLEALSCECLAEQAIAQGKKAYALALLDRSEAAAEKTLYAPDAARRTILRWQADPATAENAHIPMTQALMLQAEGALLRSDPARAVQLLDAAEEQPPQWQLLRGQAAYALGDHTAAAQYLTAAEGEYPRQVTALLEQCYLQLGDYKRAYEYAKKQN